MYRILVVEDDGFISDVLKRLLTEGGYDVEQAFSGTEAVRLADNEQFDLMILDLMLPGISGEEVLSKTDIPVIVISAKTDVESRIESLKLGADDYILKPFNNEEVLLRVNAVLRRVNKVPVEDNVIVYDDLSLDMNTMMAYIDGVPIELTNYEYNILKILMESPNRVFTKKNLYQMIWGYEYESDENVINIHISNIRKKFKRATDKEYIKTIWGLGVKINTK